MYDLVIKNGECYIDNHFQIANIYVSGGKIACISTAVLPALHEINIEGLKLLPGLIDPHVHLNLDLGRHHSCDDFINGSRMAAYGGVTTLIDFLSPILNNDTFETSLTQRLKEAENCGVDYSFHVTLGNYQDDVLTLKKKMTHYGLRSVKVFTTYSESNRQCSYDVIEKLLQEGFLVMAHAEDDDMILKERITLETYEQSRSEDSEWSAVSKLINLLGDKSGHLYIVHVSSGRTLEKLDMEKRHHLFLESCPQYFYLSKDLFETPDGNLYLLAPPLRDTHSIELMKKHIGLLNTIATDHCAFMKKEKNMYNHVSDIPKGLGTLEFAFPLMYELFGDEIIPKFTSHAADIFHLKTKGYIKVGYDADFAVLDTKKETRCHEHHSLSDYTVYDKYHLKSKIVKTILRGHVIMDELGYHPIQGHFIRR